MEELKFIIYLLIEILLFPHAFTFYVKVNKGLATRRNLCQNEVMKDVIEKRREPQACKCSCPSPLGP